MPQTVRLVLIPIAAAVAVSIAIAAVIVANRPPILVNVHSATNSSGPDSVILAGGDATVSKKPDLAIISAGLDAQAGTASTAQRDLAGKAAKLIARIKQLGVPDKELSTSGYWVGPVYDPNGQRIIGYRASEQLAVRWHNVDSVGATLDTIVQQGGATNLSVTFGLANPKAAQAEARALAIADAKSKAQAMAAAAGVQLGGVIRVTDTSSNLRPPYNQYSFGAAASSDKSVTQVPLGELDVQIMVEVDYAIA
jgi:uncharacterized protein YggE